MEQIITETFKEKGRKMLIFSNYYKSFTKIAQILETNGVKFKEIKGTGSSVNNTIKMYKETDDLNCLLLNSTNAGAGLNLENTTDLVLYHNMSSEVSIQVVGRAQRPGRTSPLNIYRLVYDNEQRNLSDISPITS
jgi:SNF2 family DNA or RNA helicase